MLCSLALLCAMQAMRDALTRLGCSVAGLHATGSCSVRRHLAWLLHKAFAH